MTCCRLCRNKYLSHLWQVVTKMRDGYSLITWHELLCNQQLLLTCPKDLPCHQIMHAKRKFQLEEEEGSYVFLEPWKWMSGRQKVSSIFRGPEKFAKRALVHTSIFQPMEISVSSILRWWCNQKVNMWPFFPVWTFCLLLQKGLYGGGTMLTL